MTGVKDRYEAVWKRKLTDEAWLKNDGRGRVEFGADLLGRLGLPDGAKVLDIGCGRGVLHSFYEGGELHGVDISEWAAAEAGRVYKQASCVNLDDEPLPYEDGFFDAALMLDVVEHLFEPGRTLVEIHRTLKPGGSLILSTPNILWWRHIRSLVVRRRLPKTSGDAYPYDGGHIHFFTYRELYDLLKDAGFRETQPAGPASGGLLYEFRDPMAWVRGVK